MRKFSTLLIAAILISALGALQSPLPAQAATSTLSFTPASLFFSSQIVGTRSSAVNITIKNTSAAANVTLGHLTISGEFRLRLGTCTTGLVLLPAQTCIFSVVFAPLAIAYRTGTVSIPSDATNPLYTVSLSGYGTGTNLLKSPGFDLPLTKPIPWKEGPNVPSVQDLLDCSIWVSPMCSVRMQGRTSPILQTLSQAVARVGAVNDKFSFLLTSKSKSIPIGGIYRVEVELLNTYNQVVGSKTVNFNTGTHGWQTAAGTIIASKQYTWVVFRITLQETSGIAWFDNAILVKIP